MVGLKGESPFLTFHLILTSAVSSNLLHNLQYSKKHIAINSFIKDILEPRMDR